MPSPQEMSTLFTGISKRYDFLNHALSLNVDTSWRKKLIKKVELAPQQKVLDLCTGTADVAIAMAKAQVDVDVIGVDISEGMLEIGREKVSRGALTERVDLRHGNAADLPYENESFDRVTISFGYRNLPDPKEGVQEMYRVLKKGGKLCILEFSPEQKGFFGKLYTIYLKTLLPIFGGLVSGSVSAYQYLSTSIPAFLKPEQVVEQLKQIGFENVTATPLFGHIAYIYEGTKS